MYIYIYVHILHTYQNCIHMSFPTCQPKRWISLQSKSTLAETAPHVTQHVLGAVRLTEVDKKIHPSKAPKKGRLCVCVWFFGKRVGGIYFPMIQPRGDTEIQHIMVFLPCSGILMLKLAQNMIRKT